ncbi:hypothetical protein T4B_9325 [Trichinella pseudospiralis]|uniref:Uncharacterized protein n=2 Tax=Trichinella pseudospiralis TaxID=6337 RepID=A0A0V1FUW6_TRIPS|nr:hypothetical protein T4E_8259 [Trichinella pseudospiralis]KRY70961.1 hypothetical protein T4A_14056 [Trichinella pseudospiralis]KRY84362.1 hypothetical protein T4D_8812 [Trichinella pseudospiralis]KRY89803.1 hypothetical protein T4D_6687 [Trichinella pseudospiralis]KRY91088.1 hypothetical protein T4D_415 [Trichinella pseudospiralis]
MLLYSPLLTFRFVQFHSVGNILPRYGRSPSLSLAGSIRRNLLTSLVNMPLSALTHTVQIAPSFLQNASMTLPIGHLLAGTRSSENMLEIQHNVTDL